MRTDTNQNELGFTPQSVFIRGKKVKNKNNYTGLTGLRE